MDELVDATLQHGLIAPVVPEFPGITVGGAFAGTAGESSSFRHGFFDATVNRCEVILADGKIVKASKTENADLFEGMKGTFGTLGVGVLFEVKLLKAAQYVDLSYHIVSGSIEQAKEVIHDACRRPVGEVDFVDGIMFSKPNGVIITGKMVDSNEDGLPIVTFHQAWDDWHYLHARNIMEKNLSGRSSLSEKTLASVYRELVPLKSYLFRYDRGAFWTGRYAYSYFITPFNRISRYVLDHFMHTRIMYHALHRSGMMEQFIIQDMALPWLNIGKFYDWVDEEFSIYPQWLCPLVADGAGGGLNPHADSLDKELDGDSGMMLNIGVWGPSPGESVATNRSIEAKLRKLKGMKWLYAQTFYTPQEFWSIYDKQSYNELRAKYTANTLPNVYDKVGDSRRNGGSGLTGLWSIWPIAGIYGVLSCLKGGDYLRKAKD